MSNEEAKEKIEAYAEERLRKAVRNYVEVNPRLESMKSWVYTLNGERYAVKVKVYRHERSEE